MKTMKSLLFLFLGVLPSQAQGFFDWEFTAMESTRNNVVYPIDVTMETSTDSIEGLVWKYYVGETYYISRKYFYNLSNRKYYKGHFYYVMHLTIENWNGGSYIDSFSRQVICIREDQGKVYVMKDEYLELLGGYSSWKHVGDATYLPYEETEEGELVLYDYNMQPGDRFPHVDGHEDIVVTQCGDTITNDGVSRRTLQLNNGCEIIEGIGCVNSTGGLLFYLNPQKTSIVWGHLMDVIDDHNSEPNNHYEYKHYLLLEYIQNILGVTSPTIEQTTIGRMYDLNGRQVTNAPQGIYIQNGKKYVK